MYASHCSYIRDLLPVKEYAQRMKKLAKRIRPKRQRRRPRRQRQQDSLSPSGIWTHAGYENQDDNYGVGRYSNEHWIGSNPHIRPCDLAPTQYNKLFSELQPDEAKSIFEHSDTLVQPAPRVTLFQGQWYRFRRGEMRALIRSATEHEHQRPHSYFLLPGILYRMFKLYGHRNTSLDNSPPGFPPQDSWFWRYYPHGKYWRKKVNNVTMNPLLNEKQYETELW
mmetsp:Transcript_14605/g.30174  ORF Transcript_14605/g.30174 Transcript_14605/m.30174 type:complete len:223 (-) Transcript_14605:2055-2723(-)